MNSYSPILPIHNRGTFLILATRIVAGAAAPDEGSLAAIMARQGSSRTTLKAGDRITAVFHPMEGGGRGGSLFYIILPDGNRLYTDIARPKPGT
jgi:hypothetical protein